LKMNLSGSCEPSKLGHDFASKGSM
jgi:hypothetical protein